MTTAQEAAALPTNDCTICSVGIGSWYESGIGRLAASLDKVGFAGTRLVMAGQLPPGCRSHAEEPYGFKAAALLHAIEASTGPTLWLDASAWAIQPLGPIFDRIRKTGSYFIADGWNVGEWCSDAALPLLGITREEGFNIPLVTAGWFGLDFRQKESRQLVTDWAAMGKAGAFRGPWGNDQGQASSDTRVRGHRHDMTALSVLVHRYGMPLVPPDEVLIRTWKNSPCIVAQGM